MHVRFSDLLGMNIPDWMVEPFGENAVMLTKHYRTMSLKCRTIRYDVI